MVFFATLKFLFWEAAVLLAAMRLARAAGFRDGAGKWLGVLAIDVTVESSIAGLLSFAGWNSPILYWSFMAGLFLLGFRERPRLSALPHPRAWAFIAALTAPLLVLAFRPVEEIDSINYLHYLLDWMANRATPYTFATNYVAFWELSFLPVWIVTGVDLFFPLLALKAIAMMGAALWLVGREIGWDGQPCLLAYDPARFKVLERHPTGSVEDALTGLLETHGWRRVGADSRGCELWIFDRHQDGMARLDRLCHGAAAGPDELFVA